MKKKIFNIELDDTDLNRLLKNCVERIKNRKKTFIVTLNALMVLDYMFNRPFKRAVDKADMVIADGIGIVKASRFFGDPVRNRIPGIDLMYRLLGLAYENRFSVFLLGAEWEVTDQVFVNLKKWFNQARFLGKYSGYFDKEEEKKIIQGINKLDPDILFVAMGSPGQELWISRNLERLNVRIIMGVGGSFDVIAGKRKRAPEKWRKKNLEWLYRSLVSPSKFLNLFKLIFFCLVTIYFKFFLLNKKKRKRRG